MLQDGLSLSFLSRYDGTVTSVTARLKLTHTHTHTHTHVGTQAHTHVHRDRDTDTHAHAHTHTHTHTQRDTHTHTHTQSNYYKHQLLTAMCSLKCYQYKFCSVQKFGVNEMFSCFWHLFCSPTLHLFAQKCSKALKYSRNISDYHQC